MQKLKLLLLACFVTSIAGYAQNLFELGGEYMRSFGRGHSGNKVGVRGETFQNKSSFSIGIIYQFSASKSYSFSRGFGMYAGYRYAFSNDTSGKSPFAGARVLFTFENFEGKTNLNSLMITPMAEAGYHFVFGKHIYAAPAVGYGYSLKITKEYNSLDEDEGGRFIPSIAAGLRF